MRVGDNPPAPEPWTRYAYIARNEFHDNQENGLDVKQSRDVDRVAEQHVPLRHPGQRHGRRHGPGGALRPERVWILYNRVHDSSNGIRCTGAQDGYYVIGNVVWNIRHEPGDPYDPNSMFGVQAIRANATPHFYAINNTIYGSDGGISAPNGSHVEIVNNLVAGLAQPSHHVAIGSSSSANILRNNVFDATARIRFGSSTVRNCPQTRRPSPPRSPSASTRTPSSSTRAGWTSTSLERRRPWNGTERARRLLAVPRALRRQHRA